MMKSRMVLRIKKSHKRRNNRFRNCFAVLQRENLPLMLLAGVLLLSACDNNRHLDSLKQYIARVKQQVPPPLKPISQPKTFPRYAYPEHSRDPFLPVSNVQKSKGFGPEQHRPRQPLEVFPFNSLRMVGTINENTITWALIAAPDEAIYRVKIGNYLGRNFGKITEITTKSIKVVERVAIVDGWESRPAKIELLQNYEKKPEK